MEISSRCPSSRGRPQGRGSPPAFPRAHCAFFLSEQLLGPPPASVSVPFPGFPPSGNHVSGTLCLPRPLASLMAAVSIFFSGCHTADLFLLRKPFSPCLRQPSAGSARSPVCLATLVLGAVTSVSRCCFIQPCSEGAVPSRALGPPCGPGCPLGCAWNLPPSFLWERVCARSPHFHRETPSGKSMA